MSNLMRAVWLAVLLAVTATWPIGGSPAWADDGGDQEESESENDGEDKGDDGGQDGTTGGSGGTGSGGNSQTEDDAGNGAGGSGGTGSGGNNQTEDDAGNGAGGSGGAGSGGNNEAQDDDHDFALKGVRAGRLYSLAVILRAARARLQTRERILDINLKRRRAAPVYEVTILGRTGTIRTLRFPALRPPRVSD